MSTSSEERGKTTVFASYGFSCQASNTMFIPTCLKGKGQARHLLTNLQKKKICGLALGNLKKLRAAGLKDKLEFMFFSRTIRKDDQDSPLAAHSQSWATDMYNVLLPLVDNEIFVIVLDLYAGF